MMLSTWFLTAATVLSVLVLLQRAAGAVRCRTYNTVTAGARIGLSRMVLNPFRPWFTLLLWVFWLVLYTGGK